MYERILVAVDGSSTSKLGLEEAVKLARQPQSRLLIVHVVDQLMPYTDPVGAAYFGDLVSLMRESGRAVIKEAEDWARQHGVEPETAMEEVVGAAAAEVIVKQATQWRADLIVLGTHGRRGVKRMVMGSDAEAVVRTTPVPVLLVRTRPSRGKAKDDGR